MFNISLNRLLFKYCPETRQFYAATLGFTIEREDIDADCELLKSQAVPLPQTGSISEACL